MRLQNVHRGRPLLLCAILAAAACDAEQAVLPRQACVSQYGITWTFAAPAPVGRYTTGDYYVVGPVTITGITPAPLPGRHGSVVNPPAGADKATLQPKAYRPFNSTFVEAMWTAYRADADAIATGTRNK